jgi:hypothetical protein
MVHAQIVGSKWLGKVACCAAALDAGPTAIPRRMDFTSKNELKSTKMRRSADGRNADSLRDRGPDWHPQAVPLLFRLSTSISNRTFETFIGQRGRHFVMADKVSWCPLFTRTRKSPSSGHEQIISRIRANQSAVGAD